MTGRWYLSCRPVFFWAYFFSRCKAYQLFNLIAFEVAFLPAGFRFVNSEQSPVYIVVESRAHHPQPFSRFFSSKKLVHFVLTSESLNTLYIRILHWTLYVNTQHS